MTIYEVKSREWGEEGVSRVLEGGGGDRSSYGSDLCVLTRVRVFGSTWTKTSKVRQCSCRLIAFALTSRCLCGAMGVHGRQTRPDGHHEVVLLVFCGAAAVHGRDHGLYGLLSYRVYVDVLHYW